ncbi:exosome complex RNA-binding protein Rrp4 [Methanobacterium alcaliphilum]|uniref:exosome complex RNA-binding protein Rrp4 n=1 Tax=Methanobacterium alcaliphilum TaxID=392018 RepID=UPI00200B0898|nr:exosome complex RNA-binding protein Rrp4 [Methanobacterium alcaliphilum]
MILVKDKDLVVPGEVLAEDDYHPGRGTFKEENKICSSVVGLVALRNKKISVIPLQSKYVPKRGDVVIGEITDIRFSMWGLDINSPYSGLLPASEVFGKEKRELEKVFDIGDVLFLRVIDVDEVKKVKLGLKGRGLGKFKGGILINITPTKVPRLIGKKGSMINMIKDKTRCDIVVGQNGVVWVNGQSDMERIAEKVILMIEDEAHTSGLTDRVRDMLAELTGEKIEVDEEETSETESLEESKDDESQVSSKTEEESSESQGEAAEQEKVVEDQEETVEKEGGDKTSQDNSEDSSNNEENKANKNLPRDLIESKLNFIKR